MANVRTPLATCTYESLDRVASGARCMAGRGVWRVQRMGLRDRGVNSSPSRVPGRCCVPCICSNNRASFPSFPRARKHVRPNARVCAHGHVRACAGACVRGCVRTAARRDVERKSWFVSSEGGCVRARVRACAGAFAQPREEMLKVKVGSFQAKEE